MKIKDIINVLEKFAPVNLQEDYDNVGLIAGNADWECTGIMISLDATEDVIKEAIEKKCNMVVSHHPVIFKGLKKINGKNYVERTVIAAIKNDVALYAVHTNLDSVLTGVNGKIADKLGLVNRKILSPKKNIFKKLAVFVPLADQQKLLDALFAAGAGEVANYSEVSYTIEGTGTYKAGKNANPYLGKIGERHIEKEAKTEVIFPYWMETKIVDAMIENHPYETVAYDIYTLANSFGEIGSGLTGEFETPLSEAGFLQKLKAVFAVPCIKHTRLTGKMIKSVAVCGGAGSFLTAAAITSGADTYITSDVKYHEFFDADGKLLVADIGHYESEQYTQDLLFDLLREKFLNFAVLKTGVNTNPVHYYT